MKRYDYKDCAAACLAIICKQYGLKYPTLKIREAAGTDKEGISALGVIRVV
nr:cysteine peptidase family C39 domain-containing protein [Clostridium botulinum]